MGGACFATLVQQPGTRIGALHAPRASPRIGPRARRVAARDMERRALGNFFSTLKG